MVISITTHWSFRLYGPFLAGPDVDHISGIDCTTYLYKGIDVTHSWDVFWNEGLEASLEVDRLRRVSHDVREQLLYLLANIQVLVLGGVVGAFE